MPALVDKAVRDLQAHVEAHLDTELRRVETEEGLSTGSLRKWCQIVRAFNPYTDKGGEGDPEIQIYNLPAVPVSQRHDLIVVRCSLDYIWTSKSEDPQVAEDFGRRWFTAVYRTIAKHHPQQAQDGSFFLWQGMDRQSEFYESTTRHAVSNSVEVRVHSPRP